MKYKEIISTIVLVLFSFSSFGAVISDNDGSSFVTKGEFDSLKASFVKQIEDYNKSIDNKIDGAIAEYISGTALAKTQNLDCNIDELDFPLTLIGHLKCMESLYATKPQTAPVIRMSYDVITDEHNREVGVFDHFSHDDASINPYWLSGEWSSGTFVVNGNCSEPVLSISGLSIIDSWGTPGANYGSNTDTGHAGIAMDYRYDTSSFGIAAYAKDPTAGDERFVGSGGMTPGISGKTKALLNDFEVNGKISASDFTTLDKIAFMSVRTDNATPFQWAAGESLDKWPAAATKRTFIDRIINFDVNMLRTWSFDVTYNDKIKYIYNIGESDESIADRKRLLVAPSLYGSKGTELYLTNRRSNRVSILSTSKGNISALFNNADHSSSKNSTGEVLNTTGFEGLITTGLNLESEYSQAGSATRTYNQDYSAIGTDDLAFKFKDTNGGVIQQYMVQGIPIMSVPQGIKSGLSYFNITLDISSEGATTKTNPKYICFSKAPITKTTFDGGSTDKGLIRSMDLYKISSGGSGIVADTDSKICKLQEGTNQIKINDSDLANLKQGDIIYAKIFFETFVSTEQYITINSTPAISIGIIN